MAVNADRAPEIGEPLACLVRPAAGEPVGEHDRVHRSRRRAGDAFDLDAAVLEELIEHAPGERAVRAAALQGEIDRLGATLAHSPRRRPAPRWTARRERVGNETCEKNRKHSRISMWRFWRRDSHNVGMILLHCNIKLWQCNKSKKCSKRVRSRHVEIQNVASAVESPARRLPAPGP